MDEYVMYNTCSIPISIYLNISIYEYIHERIGKKCTHISGIQSLFFVISEAALKYLKCFYIIFSFISLKSTYD